MSDQSSPALIDVTTLGVNVQHIVAHLCTSDCHAFGSVLQWCETRGDCCYAVVCPSCRTQFLMEEGALAELERCTEANGHALVCGVTL